MIDCQLEFKIRQYLLPASDRNEEDEFEEGLAVDESVISSPHLLWKDKCVLDAATLLSTTSSELEAQSSPVSTPGYLFSSSLEVTPCVSVIFT